MKIKLEIFSSDELKNFFTNLNHLFEIKFKNYNDIKTTNYPKNLSIIFLDDEHLLSEKTLYQINCYENYFFVCKDFLIFEKYYLKRENTLISPFSINKFIDVINNILDSKKYTFENISLNKNLLTNINTTNNIYLTQAENYILMKLFVETKIAKNILERDALQIKQKLNTSSMESHLNRIRKKLKKINAKFTISSKDNHICLETIN